MHRIQCHPCSAMVGHACSGSRQQHSLAVGSEVVGPLGASVRDSEHGGGAHEAHPQPAARSENVHAAHVAPRKCGHLRRSRRSGALCDRALSGGKRTVRHGNVKTPSAWACLQCRRDICLQALHPPQRPNARPRRAGSSRDILLRIFHRQACRCPALCWPRAWSLSSDAPTLITPGWDAMILSQASCSAGEGENRSCCMREGA